MSKEWTSSQKTSEAYAVNASPADFSRNDISLTEDSLNISHIFDDSEVKHGGSDVSNQDILISENNVSSVTASDCRKETVVVASSQGSDHRNCEATSLAETSMKKSYPDIHHSLFVPITMEIYPHDYDKLLTEAQRLSCGKFSIQKPFCIVGLHACGDLTSIVLRMFASLPTAAAICVVGCCYHHITEDCEDECTFSIFA